MLDPCRSILPKTPQTRDGATPHAPSFQPLQMEQTNDSFKPTKNTAIHVADTQVPYVIELLNKMMEEHAGLRTLIQHQHEELNLRIKDLSQLVLDSANAGDFQTCAEGIPESETLQKNEIHQDLGSSLKFNASESNTHTNNSAHSSVVSRSQVLLLQTEHTTWLEIVFCLTIILNALTMMAALQLKGLHRGSQLGLRSSDVDWNAYEPAFEALDAIFNGIYLLELLCSMYIYRMAFATNWFNWVDSIIVFVGCFHSFVMVPLNYKGAFNISVLRLFRFARIAQLLKVLRLSRYFNEVRVLLRTLGLGMQGLFWSVVLLGALIVGGGILMAQLALHFLEKDYNYISADRKKWLFEHFGTTASSVYTMFESTFTGGWRFYSRPLIDEVSYIFAVFWVTWVICVNFTTMRVVAALFLKQTMAVAALDEERQAMQNLKQKHAYAEALREVFALADSSGDNSISRKEFNAMMQDETIVDLFKQLNLDMDEVVALFGVLSSDDGEADYDEFLNGALKMNCSARTIDSVQVMHNQLKMQRDITSIVNSVKAMELHVAHIRSIPARSSPKSVKQPVT